MGNIIGKIVTVIILATLLMSALGFQISVYEVYAQLPLPPGIRREDVFVLDLVTGKPGTPSNFNAWRAGADVGILVAGMNQLCTASLWYVDTATGEVINGIAAAPPEPNQDFTVWRFKIRQGIYWSDGVEITAEDLVYTLKAGLADSGLGFHSWANVWIKNIKTEDKYTVVIELKESNPHWWMAHLTQTFGSTVRVMPRHVFERAGVDPSKYDFNPPVCAAMYTLQSF
ncbi:MAG: ABC transporter substrate-binding protein, partial [Ignisphaera sp.]